MRIYLWTGFKRPVTLCSSQRTRILTGRKYRIETQSKFTSCGQTVIGYAVIHLLLKSLFINKAHTYR